MHFSAFLMPQSLCLKANWMTHSKYNPPIRSHHISYAAREHNFDDDASNRTIWSFSSQGPPRKSTQLCTCQTFVGCNWLAEKGIYQRRWYKWERNYLGNANQVICINITSCQSILIKNGDERVWFVCSYSEKFSIFSNHIINLNRVIQAKPASQRSEYANVNFCAHLFIYTKHLRSQVEPWDFLFVHVINYSYPPDLTL